MRYYSTLFVAIVGTLLLSVVSCYPEAESIAPVLRFVSYSDTTMTQSDTNKDSTLVTFYFEDRDGDIGLPSNVGGKDITIYDMRTGNVYDYFRTPKLPDEGYKGAISGNIQIRLLSTCCIFPDDIPPCSAPEQYPSNELSLGITLTDRAGNTSDTLITPPLTLLCK